MLQKPFRISELRAVVYIEIYDQLWVLDVLHDVLGLIVAILTSFTRLTIMVGCLSLVDLTCPPVVPRS